MPAIISKIHMAASIHTLWDSIYRVCMGNHNYEADICDQVHTAKI